jgi:hypothetical protein
MNAEAFDLVADDRVRSFRGLRRSNPMRQYIQQFTRRVAHEETAHAPRLVRLLTDDRNPSSFGPLVTCVNVIDLDRQLWNRSRRDGSATVRRLEGGCKC